jgi:hypothetical protein
LETSLQLLLNSVAAKVEDDDGREALLFLLRDGVDGTFGSRPTSSVRPDMAGFCAIPENEADVAVGIAGRQGDARGESGAVTS